MPPTIQLERITPDRQDLLENLLQLYLYDYHQAVCGLAGEGMDSQGRYDLGISLDPFVEGRRDKRAFLAVVGGQTAGFVLLGDEPYLQPEPARVIVEFWVHACYRRQGIGRAFASMVLAGWAGSWELATMRRNQRAVAFWDDVVAEFTDGRFRTRDERHRGIDFHWWLFEGRSDSR